MRVSLPIAVALLKGAGGGGGGNPNQNAFINAALQNNTITLTRADGTLVPLNLENLVPNAVQNSIRDVVLQGNDLVFTKHDNTETRVPINTISLPATNVTFNQGNTGIQSNHVQGALEELSGKIKDSYVDADYDIATGILSLTTSNGIIKQVQLNKGTVQSVNGKQPNPQGAVIVDIDDIADLRQELNDRYLKTDFTNTGGQPNADKPVKLDGNGLIAENMLPPVATNEYYEVADLGAAEAGRGNYQNGDVFYTQDTQKTYLVINSDPAIPFGQTYIELSPQAINPYVEDVVYEQNTNILTVTKQGQPTEYDLSHLIGVRDWNDLIHASQSQLYNVLNPALFTDGKYYQSNGVLMPSGNWGNFKIPCQAGDVFTLFKSNHDSINHALLYNGQFVQNLVANNKTEGAWQKYNIQIPQHIQVDSISIPVHKTQNGYRTSVMLFAEDNMTAPVKFIPFTNNREVSIDGEHVGMTFDASTTTLTSSNVVDAVKELDRKFSNTVTSVNGVTPQDGNVTIGIDDINTLRQELDNRYLKTDFTDVGGIGQAGNPVKLNGTGKLSTTMIPDLAITSITNVQDTQEASNLANAGTIQVGDVVIVTGDKNKVYMFNGTQNVPFENAFIELSLGDGTVKVVNGVHPTAAGEVNITIDNIPDLRTELDKKIETINSQAPVGTNIDLTFEKIADEISLKVAGHTIGTADLSDYVKTADFTDVGGNTHAGEPVKLDNAGLIAESMLPKVATSEYDSVANISVAEAQRQNYQNGDIIHTQDDDKKYLVINTQAVDFNDSIVELNSQTIINYVENVEYDKQTYKITVTKNTGQEEIDLSELNTKINQVSPTNGNINLSVDTAGADTINFKVENTDFGVLTYMTVAQVQEIKDLFV